MKIINTPIKINHLELHNRLVMPPMATSKSESDGKVSKELCEYYNTKSNGGHIGLIIVEHSYVSQEGKANIGQLSISKDSDIDGLKEIVSIIHKNNTKVFAQINHAGGATTMEITGTTPLGVSSIKLPAPRNTIPQKMSQSDIDKVISDFTKAAYRAKLAGFDGVEIHSAHGYLLNQFYSPLTNNRDDKYNGYSIQGRIKLHLEIIKSIRKVVGEDYPLAIRLGACDYISGGTTIEDSITAAKEFEKAGIDLLDISGGFCLYTNPYSNEQGYFKEISEKIKKEVNIPVILTGGITDINIAEKLLIEKKADLIGVGRAILKDSNWAKNAIVSSSEIENVNNFVYLLSLDY